MEETLLNTEKVYETRTPEDECYWKYEYRAVSGHGGDRWSWYAFRRRPGMEDYTPMGPMSELEVYSRLIRTGSHELDDEDRTDLLFWLYLGGIERFLEESKKE